MDVEQERLLYLAKQLRDAATAAGRADVVAKIDDVVLVIADGDADAGVKTTESKGNVVLRILDGLGF